MFLLLLFYLGLVLIRPQDYPAFADSHWPYQQGALIVAFVIWLILGRKRFEAPQYLLLAAFLLVMMVSKIVNGWAGGALVIATQFVPILLSFVLLAQVADDGRRLRVVMALFAACACVLAIHGIQQALTGKGWTGIGLSQETRIQYVGIFNDPNDLGLLFVMCLPMAVYLSTRGGLMGLRRLFWLAVAGTLLYGVYLTNSRGTMLALLAIVGLYVWRKRGLLVAGILGGGALAAMLALPSRLQDVDVSEESAFGRVDSWYEGMQMFTSHPIFGVGAGNYTDYNELTAHNSFMLVLAETGFIGFTIWLAFIGYCSWMLLAILRADPNAPLQELDDDVDDEEALAILDDWDRDRAMAFALAMSWCGFFVAVFFLSRSYAIVLYLLAAMVIAHYEAMRRRYGCLPRFALMNHVLLWPAICVAAIAVLFVVIKILLAVA